MKLGKLLMIVSSNTFIRLYDMHNNFICESYNQVGTFMDYIDETVVHIDLEESSNPDLVNPTVMRVTINILYR